MRVVIDTNVVASAIFFGGNPQKVIDEMKLLNVPRSTHSRELLRRFNHNVEKARPTAE